MDFKGTRGKWKYRYDGFEYCYDIVSDNEFICTTMSGNTKAKADALLISKAPQLLEEHNVDIDQIEVWIEWLKDLENDERYIGITDTMKKCIEVKKQLIKEATEL